jgi:hypothetical protein
MTSTNSWWGAMAKAEVHVRLVPLLGLRRHMHWGSDWGMHWGSDWGSDCMWPSSAVGIKEAYTFGFRLGYALRFRLHVAWFCCWD